MGLIDKGKMPNPSVGYSTLVALDPCGCTNGVLHAAQLRWEQHSAPLATT